MNGYARTIFCVIFLLAALTVSAAEKTGAKLALASFSNGTYSELNAAGNLAAIWKSKATAGQPQITVDRGKNGYGTYIHDIVVSTDGYLRLTAGSSHSATYTVKVSEGYYIAEFSIAGTASGGDFTIYSGSGDYKTTTVYTHDIPNGVTLKRDASLQQDTIQFTITSSSNETDGSINLGSTSMGLNIGLKKITYHVKPTYSDEKTYPLFQLQGQHYRMPNGLDKPFCDFSFFTDANHNNKLDTATAVIPENETDENIYLTYNFDQQKAEAQMHWRYSVPTAADFSKTDDPHWYYLSFDVDGTIYYANGLTATTDIPMSDEALWCMVGDPFDTYIINKATGQYLGTSEDVTAYDNGNPYALSLSDEKQTYSRWTMLGWRLVDSDDVEDDFTFDLQGPTRHTLLIANPTDTKIQVFTFSNYGSVGGIAYDYNTSKKQSTYASIRTVKPVKVNYAVLRSEDDIAASGTGYAFPGSEASLPTALRRGFCQYTYNPTTIATDNTKDQEIQVSYVVSGMPFETSDSKDNLNRFYTFGAGIPNRQVNYISTSTTTAQATKKKELNNGTVRDGNLSTTVACSFAFVGDPYDMKIYNRVTGSTRPLGVLASDVASVTTSQSADHGPQFTSDADAYTSWDIFDCNQSFTYPTSKTAHGFILRLKNKPTIYACLAGYVGLRAFSEADEAKLHDEGTGYITSTNGTTAAPSILFFTPEKIAANVTFSIYQSKEDSNPSSVTLDVAYAPPSLPASVSADYTTYKFYASLEDLQNGTPEWPSTTDVKSGDNVYALATTSADLLPFTPSTLSSDGQSDDMHWYYLRMRGNKASDNTDQSVLDRDQRWNYIDATGPGPYHKSKTHPYTPSSLWAFVGNTTDGFVVYNKWYGPDYVLTNPYGDEYSSQKSNAVHDEWKGPVMMKRSIADNEGYTYKWRLVKAAATGSTAVDDNVFGLTDKANASMSINSYNNLNEVTFYFWNSKLAMNSRLIAEDASTATPIADDLQTAADSILAIPDAALYGLTATAKTELKKALGDELKVSDANASKVATLLGNPENYISLSDFMPEGGNKAYVRLQNVSTGRYLNIAQGDYAISSSEPTSTPAMQQLSDTDAGQIFCISTTDGSNVSIAAQGFDIIPAASTGATYTSAESETSDGSSSTSTDGGASATSGRAHLLAMIAPGKASFSATAVTLHPWLNAMSWQGSQTKSASLNTPDAASWIVVPADEIKVAKLISPPAIEGDAYAGYSFQSLCYPFAVKYTGDGQLYYCSGKDGKTINMAEITPADGERVVPANTPFIYKSLSKEPPTFTIASSSADLSGSADAFRGVFLSKKYEESFLHDDVWVLGYSTRNILSDGNGGKTGWGFRHSSNHTSVGPNKGYLYTGSSDGTDSQAKGFAMQFFDEAATTGIGLRRQTLPSGQYFDLQGRRVSKPAAAGIYILNGRKVVTRVSHVF